jgi:3-oxoadipate CoA-transferase alpha subunit
MIDKVVPDVAAALAGVGSGATVAVGGFGESGMPWFLLAAVHEAGIGNLTIVANNAGSGGRGISALLASGRVRKVVCSYPRSTGSTEFEALYARDAIELEIVPQGTLSERLRAGAAGLGGFYTPTAAGTLLAEGKEQREIDGRRYVFERPLRPDIALIHADRADRFGNCTYHSAARNFSPVMAAAAHLTIVEARQIVPLGALDPEIIVTPGIFVDRVVGIAV